MGGQAFSSGPKALYTPRMKPDMYHAFRDRCQSKLRDVFVYVATPIEGPGKADFGDIDILVALERRLVFPGPDDSPAEPESVPELRTRVAEALGAEDWKFPLGMGVNCNFAVPWPSDLDVVDDVDDKEETSPAPAPAPKRYVQVDVNLCASLDEFEFKLFKHAHGDLWNLLGSIIRPFGLTVDEEALWLRIPQLEMEQAGRKRSRVRVTSEPAEVLHFLGLRVGDQWDAPFGSVDELFEYATTCRLFWVWAAKDGASSGDDSMPVKTADRKRMSGRPVFRRFIDDFIPKCRAEGRHVARSPFTTAEMRDRVREQVFERFLDVGPSYAEALRAWRRQTDLKGMKALIREEMPPAAPADTVAAPGSTANAADLVLDRHFHGCAVSALYKVIVGGNDSFDTVPCPPLKDAHDVYDLEATRRFVRNNWERVGRVAWDRQLAKMAVKKMQQGVKRSAEESEEAQPDETKS